MIPESLMSILEFQSKYYRNWGWVVTFGMTILLLIFANKKEKLHKTPRVKPLGFLAGAAGIEPATNGFGDRTLPIELYLSVYSKHIRHLIVYNRYLSMSMGSVKIFKISCICLSIFSIKCQFNIKTSGF